MINPIYRAYATAHGKTPEEMLERDKEAYPGGCMTGFILWVSARMQEYFTIRPEAFFGRPDQLVCRDDFHKWLHGLYAVNY